MAKSNTIFVCSECGATSPRWLGRCPSCGKFNTMAEEIVAPAAAAPKKAATHHTAHALPLSQVGYKSYERTPSGISEFDNVIGGGIVKGSLVLLGGDPGIGKSTILTQIAAHLSQAHRVLYFSAEESCSQVKLRTERLGLDSDNLLLIRGRGVVGLGAEIDGVELWVIVLRGGG